ncbi:MAG: hypothetical protein H6719_11195 [Sandaracinaceae bacterium]|nr:hypothetical protein [Sandaracinaceae bacterium]
MRWWLELACAAALTLPAASSHAQETPEAATSDEASDEAAAPCPSGWAEDGPDCVHTSMPTVVVGSVLLGLGYVFGVVTGTMYVTNTPPNIGHDPNAAFNYIPVAGGLVWMFTGRAHLAPLLFGIPTTIAQVVGLAMLSFALLLPRRRARGPVTDLAVAWGPGDAGLQVLGRF